MSKLIKKTIQYTVDQGIDESAAKAGLTSAAVHAEIARTGKIPVSNQASDEDLSTAQLVALSHHLPSVKITDAKSASAFLENDGGY